jgi:hypothetical protein
MLLVNLKPLYPALQCQPLFCLSSKTGNGSDIQGTFDEVMTKVKTHIRVSVFHPTAIRLAISVMVFFSSGGSRFIEEMGEISTSY